MSEREPDIGEDPRKQDTGDGGYPEQDPAGSPGGGEAPYEPDDSAPDTDAPQDDDPGGATGNPGAAGA